MAGEERNDEERNDEERYGEVIAYLTRLMGQAPGVDEPLRLRSVHRAALASWARKRNVPLRLSAMGSAARFSVRDLLGGDRPAAVPGDPALPASASHGIPDAADAALLGGMGIDIEEVGNLPHAADYREHPFYQDNFSPAEIAYCLRQRDVRASFCGTWAAKEALLKSGAVAATGQFKGIEVGRDPASRPYYPGCQLSISHTATMAIAVCVFSSPPLAEPADGGERSQVSGHAISATAPAVRRWPWSRA